MYNNNFNRLLTIVFGILTIPTLAKELVIPIWTYSEIMVPIDKNIMNICSLINAFIVIIIIVYSLRVLLKYNNK